MNFYRIDTSSDEKVVGIVPQISEAVYPTTVDDPRGLQKFFNIKADENVLIPKPILRKKAKLTDYLSNTLSRPVFSGKLKTLFETSKYFGVQFFETSIYVNEKEVPDFWLANAYEYGYEYLDLNHSKFSIMTGILDKMPIGEVNFNSSGEVRKAFKDHDELAQRVGVLKHQSLRISNVVIREDADTDFFLLRLVSGGIGYYVSQLLKDAIENVGCTGILFKNPNDDWY